MTNQSSEKEHARRPMTTEIETNDKPQTIFTTDESIICTN